VWEARTAKDSDDEGRFMEAYAQALDSQLDQTKMAQSFDRGAVQATGTGAAPPGAAGEAVLQPVDLDVNLANSLLASYSSQQGLPGPASSLAGLLGVTLPDPDAIHPTETPKIRLLLSPS